jgi:CRP-like cAMP-binding protein
MNPGINALIAALPADEYDAVTREMHLVSLSKGQTLFEVGQRPDHVHYPVGAVVSMINDAPDGSSLETYMLGKTCMVGVGAVHMPSFYRARVRSSGLAYRLSVDRLREIWATCPTYRQGAQLAMERIVMHMSQSVVCGKKHPVDQQLVRWLLITLDRTLTARIDITHLELADLLGFRREVVTLAMGRLTAAGAIATSRGAITVLQRDLLERRSCDCYWVGSQRARSAMAQAA